MAAPNRSRGRIHIRSLAITVDGAALPTEFRLFVAGWNKTENGDYLFDAEAAKRTMAAYRAHAVDRMIDLEHLSLDTESRNFDPDARGWARLELRPDGSLWAVDVRWTPDGSRRLTEGTQRFVSPAFTIDEKSKRITSILNIAITAMPATHGTEALVAAAVGDGSVTMQELAQVAEALGLGPEATVEDILGTIAAMAKKLQEATSPTEEMPAAAEVSTDLDEERPVAARNRRTVRKTLSVGYVEQLSARVDEWRKSHIELAAREKAVEVERLALETAERRKLVGELVKLGAETPATAWSDAKGTVPVDRLAAESLASLKDRVQKLAAPRGGGARPPSAAAAALPPADPPDGELSERELRICEETKTDPRVFLAARRRFKGK
jgi:phage I-like protein